ncbi:MAG: glycoside hydrolase, partial [Rhodothermaceae bacterium]|nr:glycoside hydrolase [Rhodothermaceae bacterium]
RAVSTSSDGGMTWSSVVLDSTLIEPVCQASLLKHGEALLFSNPASTNREKMTIRVSYDNGVSWPVEQEIYNGSAAYSSLVSLPEDQVGLLYERNEYGEIVFWQGSLPDLPQ